MNIYWIAFLHRFVAADKDEIGTGGETGETDQVESTLNEVLHELSTPIISTKFNEGTLN